jgi:hypothetical protein
VVSGDFTYIISRLGQVFPRAAAGVVALNAFLGLDPPDVAALILARGGAGSRGRAVPVVPEGGVVAAPPAGVPRSRRGPGS